MPLNFNDSYFYISVLLLVAVLLVLGTYALFRFIYTFRRLLRVVKYRDLQLKQYENRDTLILESIAEGVFGIDVQGNVTFINSRAKQLLGYESDIIGKPLHNTVHHSKIDGEHYDVDECPITKTIKTGKAFEVSDEAFWHKTNGQFPVEYKSRPLIAEGVISGAVVTFSDISVRKRNEDMLFHTAHFDFLTQLPNRAYFMETIDRAIKKAERARKKMALLYFDIDGFKHINDTLGHAAGDELLAQLAERVNQTVRDTDFLSRLAGDEFVILCDDLSSHDEAAQLANRMISAFKKPFTINHRERVVTISIGIAVYPYAGKSADQLLRCADAALYKAKARGKNTYRFYTDKLNEIS